MRVYASDSVKNIAPIATGSDSFLSETHSMTERYGNGSMETDYDNLMGAIFLSETDSETDSQSMKETPLKTLANTSESLWDKCMYISAMHHVSLS